MEKEQTTKDKPSNRFFRLLLRVMLYGTALVVVAVLGVFLLAQTDGVREKAKGFLEAAVSENLGLKIEIGKITGDLLFSAGLEQIKISEAETPLFEADAVRISFLSPLLLKRVLFINEIEIENGRLLLKSNPDGTLHLPALKIDAKPDETKKDADLDLNVILRRISIVNGEVVHPSRRIKNIQFAASLSLKPGSDIFVEIYDARFDADHPEFNLKRVTGKLSYSPQTRRLGVERMRFRSGASDLSLSGAATFNDPDPLLDITLDMHELSLAEIGRLADIRTPHTGEVKGRLSVKGTPRRFFHRSTLNLDPLSLETQGVIQIEGGNRLTLAVNGRVENLTGEMLAAWGAPPTKDRINGTFDIQGNRLNGPGQKGSINLTVSDSVVSGYSLNEGRVRIRLDGRHLILDEGRFQTPFGSALAEGDFKGLLEPDGLKSLALKVDLRELDPAALTGDPDLKGKLNLALGIEAHQLKPEMRFEALAAKLEARIDASQLSGITIHNGSIRAAWSGDRLDIEIVKAATHAGDILLSGFALPWKKQSDLNYRLSLPDLQEIPPIFQKTGLMPKPLKGRVTVDGQWRGWWDRPEIRAAISGEQVVFNEYGAEQLFMDGNWTGLYPQFTADAVIKGKGLSINAVRVPWLDLTAAVTPETLMINLKGVHSGGDAVDLSGSIKGWRESEKQITIDKLRLTPAADSSIREIAKQVVNTEPIRITTAQNAIRIQSLALESDRTTLTVTGAVNPEASSDLRLSVAGLNLNRLSRLLTGEEKVKGMVSARAQVTGTGSNPRIQAHINLKDGSGYGISVSDLTFKLDYADNEAHADLKVYRNKTQQLHAFGTAPLDLSLLPFKYGLKGGMDVSVKTEDFDLSQLPLPKTAPMGYRGRLDGTIRLTGDLKTPTVAGDFSVKNGSVSFKAQDRQDIPISKLALTLRYDKENTQITGKLEQNPNTILSFSGAAPMVFSLFPFQSLLKGSMDLNLDTRNLDLAGLPIPSNPLIDYDGRMDLSLAVTGRLDAPAVTSRLLLRDGRISIKKDAAQDIPFSELELNLNFRNRQGQIRGSITRDGEKLLFADGTAGMDLSLFPFQFTPLPKGLNLLVETRGLPLSRLPLPKPPDYAFDGKLNLSARLSGDITAPEISGTLRVAEGFFNVKSPALSYESVSADLQLLPGKLIIHRIEIKGDTEGMLTCSGEIALSSFTPTRLRIHLDGDNFQVPFHRAIRAKIKPRITLEGTPAEPRLTGEVTILESRVDLDLLSQQGPAEIQVVSGKSEKNGKIDLVEADAQGLGALKPLAADLLVVIPKKSWLRGQGLEAEIGGQIKIQKAPKKPFVLLGSLQTLRGRYMFQGKVFKLEKGTVSFLGLEEPNPVLDIQAVNRIKKVDIIIQISGSARDLKLTLDSNPQMEQADIVSYLVFGQPAGSLKGQQSVNAEKAAMAVTGQIAAAELRKILEDVFFLDSVTVDAGGGDLHDGSVSVGKYVAPDVFVTYKKGLKSDSPHEGEVAYEINKNMSVQTQVGDEKNTGVDFLWKFDF